MYNYRVIQTCHGFRNFLSFAQTAEPFGATTGFPFPWFIPKSVNFTDIIFLKNNNVDIV